MANIPYTVTICYELLAARAMEGRLKYGLNLVNVWLHRAWREKNPCIFIGIHWTTETNKQLFMVPILLINCSRRIKHSTVGSEWTQWVGLLQGNLARKSGVIKRPGSLFCFHLLPPISNYLPCWWAQKQIFHSPEGFFLMSKQATDISVILFKHCKIQHFRKWFVQIVHTDR